jgi:hypothetical protein
MSWVEDRTVLAYLRNNTLAFVALCVALFSLGGATAYAVNTVRSTDIVDGQVLTQDLGNNAVTTAKIKDGQVTNADIAANSIGNGKIIDNQVTGADVNEATLDEVPSAARLGATPAGYLRAGTSSNTVTTGSCTSSGIWTACAPVSLTVPANHVYRVTVVTTVTLNPAGDVTELTCPALEGPTCMSGYPERTTFLGGSYTTASRTYSGLYSAGVHTFSTAIKTVAAVAADAAARTNTTVTWHEYDQEVLSG